jgi:hypothetical protein
LRGKTVVEIKQVIADLCQRETDPQLREVLEEMFAAAGKMS